MPRFEDGTSEEWERLKPATKGYQDRQIYRDELSKLLDGVGYRKIYPDEGESLRKVKNNVSRAGRDLDVKIQYKESQEGYLMVRLADATKTPPSGRGRRRRGQQS